MNKYACLLLLFFGLSFRGSDAQTPVSSPPLPPYTNKVRPFSSWEITFQSTDSPKPGGPQNPTKQQIDVAKTDKLRQEVTNWSDGKTSEIWYVGQYSLTQTVYRPDIYIKAKDHSSLYMPSLVQSFDESDFPELAWLSADSYDRLISYQGHKCYHFQVKQKPMLEMPSAPGAPKAISPSPFAGLVQEAWIDVQTKLPRAWTDGKYLRTYEFKIGSVDHLEMPDRFSKALHDYLERARTAR